MKIPPMNLAPESTPWGRAIGELSTDSGRRISQLEASLSNLNRRAGFSAQQSELNELTDDVTALDGRVDTLEARAVQGVIPASVVVGSGSATVAADGTVTFSGASSVSLNEVFDGLGADTYQVFSRGISTGTSAIAHRLRAAGVDLSTASYLRAAQYTTLYAGPTRLSSTSDTQGGYLSPNPTPADFQGMMTIYSPGKSNVITFFRMESVAAAGGDRFNWSEGGNVDNGDSYDGITLRVAGGTMTGWIKAVKVG